MPHYSPADKSALETGFTLIEMSIVIVIIGLIVGGILVGQDLIKAAAVRAQIAQIEKYNTAAHTFQGKYGYLPGDAPDPNASNFGFIARGSFAGEGDGNGVLEGNAHVGWGANCDGCNNGLVIGIGETATFWVDLSTAKLVDSGIAYLGADYPNETVPTAAGSCFSGGTCATLSSTPSLKQFLPLAKLGTNNFVYVYSMNGTNYYAVSVVVDEGWTVESNVDPGITVQQAYVIDSKIDDGLPQSGNVTACYVNANVVAYQTVWAAGGANGTNQGASGGVNCVPTTGATPYSITNCYDNGGGGTEKYSTSQNANLPNCALSFKFQ